MPRLRRALRQRPLVEREAPPTAGAETAAVSAAADGEAGLLVCLAPYPARQLHICEKCEKCVCCVSGEKERINKLQSPFTMIVILRAWMAQRFTSYRRVPSKRQYGDTLPQIRGIHLKQTDEVNFCSMLQRCDSMRLKAKISLCPAHTSVCRHSTTECCISIP
jgi:hypothetical protein